MSTSRCFANTIPGKAKWAFALLMLLSAALQAAGPDPAGLVFYLSGEDAKNPVDGSANPTTVAVEGSLSSVEGQLGTRGLEFPGNNANRIQVAHADKLAGMSALTIEAWVLARNIASHEGMAIVSKRVANLNADEYNLFIWTGRLVNGRVNGNNTNIGLSKTVIAENTWYHIALVFNAQGAANEQIKLYVNGVQESSATHPATAVGAGVSPVWIGDLDAARNFPWDGVLDELGIWNIALTEADIQLLMTQSKAKLLNRGTATNPTPADGSEDVLITTDLAWAPGEYAATHNVYLGASREDVDAADPSVLKATGLARDVTSLDVGALDFGRTYYWRVDEVNAAPDNAVHEGDIWSFTTEPYAYPITGVTATASSGQVAMGPENTVNGSGLNAQDQHSTEGTQMWLTTGAQPNWIQFEFDKVYKLHELLVWNSNQLIEAFIGFGAKDVKIEYSLDGSDWTALEGVPEFARASAAATYTHNTTVDFGGVTAKYVKLTIESSWGGMPTTGLSEVRFFAVPVLARAPMPADGATDVALDAELNWRPGREATSHKVLFGIDEAAVTAGTAASQTVSDYSFTPAAMNFGTKYFWKVDEVGDAGTFEGELWSFTSREYAIIDDMESYNDDDHRIYQAWVDGVTTGASGSTVGYMQAPFAEKAIVQSGRQSMPFEYNNAEAPFFSEAEQEFSAAQNWTVNGADTLSLWVRGNPAPFSEEAGVITMSAAGHDIWDNADDFRFAYKTLSGDGSVVVKVESMVNTSNWAKAGVMIRQSLDADSKFAYMIVSYAQGLSLGSRQTTAGACGSTTQTGVAAPQWVKLIRKGDVFTAQYSADGTTWTDMKAADGTIASTTVAMTNPVYIGLCVTSHNAAATTTAVLSGAATTGNVTGGSWQVLAIGDDPQPANAPADLYVTVLDSAGKKATAVNPTAVTTAAWTQWQIPLSSFAGVNFKSVKKLVVGVDSRTSPSKGAGMIFVDDIGFGHPAQ